MFSKLKKMKKTILAVAFLDIFLTSTALAHARILSYGGLKKYNNLTQKSMKNM
jgi:hypothetical protein